MGYIFCMFSLFKAFEIVFKICIMLFIYKKKQIQVGVQGDSNLIFNFKQKFHYKHTLKFKNYNEDYQKKVCRITLFPSES